MSIEEMKELIKGGLAPQDEALFKAHLIDELVLLRSMIKLNHDRSVENQANIDLHTERMDAISNQLDDEPVKSDEDQQKAQDDDALNRKFANTCWRLIDNRGECHSIRCLECPGDRKYNKDEPCDHNGWSGDGLSYEADAKTATSAIKWLEKHGLYKKD